MQEAPPAVIPPSSHVPPRPSLSHIWDNGVWRKMTAGEAVYLKGERIKE